MSDTNGGSIFMKKIGWIGIGNMGKHMVRRLMDAGHEMYVLQRPSANTQAIIAQGAKPVKTVAELGRQVDYIFTMIPNSSTLKEILYGESGLISATPVDSKLIDMSTIDPQSSAEFAAALEQNGIGYLRAPVTGSTEYAMEGTLGIMVSGDRNLYDEAMPLLRILGNRQIYLGSGEEARYFKIIINMLLGNIMQTLGESLSLGKKAGLDWSTMIDMIADSAAAAPIIKYKVEALKKLDFTAMATAEMMKKDLDIASSLISDYSLHLPVTEITRRCYGVMSEQNLEKLDMSAVMLVNEANHELKTEVLRQENRIGKKSISPAKMKAVVAIGPGDFLIQAIDIPEPGRGEALCRIRSVALCGSDPGLFAGKRLDKGWPPA
jgi:3-hydroxyisobutyrate dehydrogenase/glyoxylate/succinic semialdehyde reductase